MILYGVECERVQPIAPEIYVCHQKDRLTLVKGLLSDGKGSRIRLQAAIEGSKGITGRPFAMIEVESYS